MKLGNVTLIEHLFEPGGVEIAVTIPELTKKEGFIPVGFAVWVPGGRWLVQLIEAKHDLLLFDSRQAAISVLVAHGEKKYAESARLPTKR
jgi:hypothetical protein